MPTHRNHFSQFDEDEYRLPEGMKRIAYDADTQRYTFRDRSGQLYESAPGSRYGVLQPVLGPQHRRNATVSAVPDTTLRRKQTTAGRPAKTFGDILPSDCITSAQVGADWATLPSHALFSGGDLVQAAMPKVHEVVEVVRRRTTLKKRKEKEPEPASKSEEGATPAASNPDWATVPSHVLFKSDLVQAAIPKVQGVVEVVRRRTTLKRQKEKEPAAHNQSESASVASGADEKRGLLRDDWEIVRKEEVPRDTRFNRLKRSKSEVRLPKFRWPEWASKNVGIRGHRSGASVSR